MLDRIDKKFEKLGYTKVEDGPIVISYEKDIYREYDNDIYQKSGKLVRSTESNEFMYTHCIDICYKDSGRHIIQSYEKTVKNGFNSVVGLGIEETKLILRKMKKYKSRYIKYKYNKNKKENKNV